jgi:hypothetical protein
LVEQCPGQLTVVIVESAGQRFDEGAVFDAHPTARQVSETAWVALSAIKASSMSRTDRVSKVEATADTLISARLRAAPPTAASNENVPVSDRSAAGCNHATPAQARAARNWAVADHSR